MRPLLLSMASHVAILAARAAQAFPMSPRLRRRSTAVRERLGRLQEPLRAVESASGHTPYATAFSTPLNSPPQSPLHFRQRPFSTGSAPAASAAAMAASAAAIPATAATATTAATAAAAPVSSSRSAGVRWPNPLVPTPSGSQTVVTGSGSPSAFVASDLPAPVSPYVGISGSEGDGVDATFIYDDMPPGLRPAMEQLRLRMSQLALPNETMARLTAVNQAVNDAVTMAKDRARQGVDEARQRVDEAVDKARHQFDEVWILLRRWKKSL